MNVPQTLPNLPPVIPDLTEGWPRVVQRWRWWIHLVLIGGYPLVLGLVGWIWRDDGGPALTNGTKGLLIACGKELFVFGILFGLGWLASRASRDDLLWRWRPRFWAVPLGIGYSVALRLLLGVMVLMIGIILVVTHVVTPQGIQKFFLDNRPDVEAIVDISAMRQNPVYYWLTVTLVSFVVAGFREELWRAGVLAGLRTLWPRVFGSRFGRFGAVGIAALVFGLGHLPQGLLAVCLTALIGFGLGVIMILHRSIWPAVIAHGMFDATSLAFLPWVMKMLPEIQRSLGH